MLAFRPLFDARVELAEILTLGHTPLGERRVIDIRGGSFRGARLSGRVRAGRRGLADRRGRRRRPSRRALHAGDRWRRADPGPQPGSPSRPPRGPPPARRRRGRRPRAVLLPDRAAVRDRGAGPRLAEPRHRGCARSPAPAGRRARGVRAALRIVPFMILIEHATVLTLDRERRILTDGSVLVDGRDIVQVGPAATVRPPRPPDRVIDGRRRVVAPRLRGHARPPLGAPEPRPPPRRHPRRPVPPGLADPALLRDHAGGGAGVRAPRLRRDDPHRAPRRSARRARSSTWRAVADAVEPVGMRAVLGRWTWDLDDRAGAHAADDRRGAPALNAAMLEQGARPRRRPDRGVAAAARLRHVLAGADPGRPGAGRAARRRLGHDALRARIPRAGRPIASRSPSWTRSACSRPRPSSPTWSTSTTPTSRSWPGGA